MSNQRYRCLLCHAEFSEGGMLSHLEVMHKVGRSEDPEMYYARVEEENKTPVADVLAAEATAVAENEQAFADSLVSLMDLAAITRDNAGFPLTPRNTTVQELLNAADWQILNLDQAQHTGAADRLRKCKKMIAGILRAANIKRGILP